jgi:hypothetical protein
MNGSVASPAHHAQRFRCAARVRPALRTIAVAIACVAPLAHGQVFKCVDANGGTTYQQEPCAGGQQGRALNLKTDKETAPAPDLTPQWSAAASEGRIATGMPRRWVIEALGSPAERRSARSGETGSEIWVYVRANEMTRVGFVGDVVVWTVRDAVKAPEAARSSEARNKVAAGRHCDEVRAELGPADRQEPVADVDAATGQARGPTGTRYVYEPGPGDGGIRLSFTCFDNRVIDIARALYAR